MSKDTYDESFYIRQMEGSYKSALEYASYLTKMLKIRSVVDVGCGRGTWLKAFYDYGACKLVGYDGPWNNQSKMIDEAISFVSADLNEPLPLPSEKFDIAMSLEVAEHLKDTSAKNFVKNLTLLSDVVMFGAAYTNQGGADHINEKPHTYWANIFSDLGYEPYDIFRPVFWGCKNVEFWYQQNTFLYVKQSSDSSAQIEKAGWTAMANIGFMDCIHPKLYTNWTVRAERAERNSIESRLLAVVPESLRPLARRIKRSILG